MRRPAALRIAAPIANALIAVYPLVRLWRRGSNRAVDNR
jgi:hypothetical protein